MFELREFAQANGLNDFDCSTSGALHRSLERLRETVRRTDETMNNGGVNAIYEIINLLATKPMQLAQYFCTGQLPEEESWRHYALRLGNLEAQLRDSQRREEHLLLTLQGLKDKIA